jgi:serine/threonine protein kinase
MIVMFVCARYSSVSSAVTDQLGDNMYSYMCVSFLNTYLYTTACSHNVLIDDYGRALLTDFGLSKTETTISAAATTKSLFNGGTLAWTAPEMFKGRKGKAIYTRKSDVYSYGIVIWEVLCNLYPSAAYNGGELSNVPWYGLGFVELMCAVTAGERPTVPALALSNDNVFKATTYSSIMRQCLGSDPSVRPSFLGIADIIVRFL